jgi:hypothetical protein
MSSTANLQTYDGTPVLVIGPCPSASSDVIVRFLKDGEHVEAGEIAYVPSRLLNGTDTPASMDLDCSSSPEADNAISA